MSFFENLKILLKKHYIITSSASACAISAALPLWCVDTRIVCHKRLHNAVDCTFAERSHKDGPKDGEAVWGILVCGILRDVEKREKREKREKGENK